MWLWDILVLWTVGPWVLGFWTLGLFAFRTLEPLPYSTTSSHFLLPPPMSSSYFFLPPPTFSYRFGMGGWCYSAQKSFMVGGIAIILQAPGPGLLEIWDRPWDLRLLEFNWRWPGPKLENNASSYNKWFFCIPIFVLMVIDALGATSWLKMMNNEKTSGSNQTLCTKRG